MQAKPHILLIEREASQRNLWAQHLARWGFTFALAATGEEVLTLAGEGIYGMVLMDVTDLPNRPKFRESSTGGRTLLGKLQARQPEAVIIALAEAPTIADTVEIMRAGALDVIVKPVDFTLARSQLEHILANQEPPPQKVPGRSEEDAFATLRHLHEKFIAITSHELRTPVNVIKNISDILSKELLSEELLSKELHSEALHPLQPMIDLLRCSSQQMTEIVNRMQETVQLNSGKTMLHFQTFPLEWMVREVIEELMLASQERDLCFSLNIPVQLSIKADRVKLKKVIRELLQNAIKFTPDQGSIKLESYLRENGELAITIRDSGIGIAQSQHLKIFNLFYEVAAPTHHHTSGHEFMGGGMGVGLNIVKEIIGAHQGRVEVSSQLGEGSRFTLILPHQDTAQQSTAQQSTVQQSSALQKPVQQKTAQMEGNPENRQWSKQQWNSRGAIPS